MFPGRQQSWLGISLPRVKFFFVFVVVLFGFAGRRKRWQQRGRRLDRRTGGMGYPRLTQGSNRSTLPSCSSCHHVPYFGVLYVSQRPLPLPPVAFSAAPFPAPASPPWCRINRRLFKPAQLAPPSRTTATTTTTNLYRTPSPPPPSPSLPPPTSPPPPPTKSTPPSVILPPLLFSPRPPTYPDRAAGSRPHPDE